MKKGAVVNWKPEHSDELVRLAATGAQTFEEIAAALNEKFGTSYTRNSAIGRAKRVGICKPRLLGPSISAIKRRRDREHERKKRNRQKNWAHNPSLEARYQRRAAKSGICKMMLAGGATKTSMAYRKHLPPLPEMSKNQLRAMLTAAVENTAAMVTV